MFHLNLLHIFVLCLFRIHRMKAYKKNKITLIAWLLLLVFNLPILIKNIHIYQNECADYLHGHATGDKAKHDCNTCPVCQFVYSTFLADDLDHTSNLITVFSCEISIPYIAGNYYSDHTYISLRAPPFTS